MPMTKAQRNAYKDAQVLRRERQAVERAKQHKTFEPHRNPKPKRRYVVKPVRCTQNRKMRACSTCDEPRCPGRAKLDVMIKEN